MENKTHIIYIVNNYIPEGKAYSSRALNLARLFSQISFNIHIIADYTFATNFKRYEKYKYENFTFEIVGENNNAYRFFKSKNVVKQQIIKYIKEFKVSHIIIPNSDWARFSLVKKICDKNKIHLILEACEWYNRASFKLSYFDPRYIKYTHYMKYNYAKVDGVIAISRYLEEHFKEKQKCVIRIPTILDFDKEYNFTGNNNDKIVLIFAGGVRAGKENFKNIFLALQNFGERNPFILRIFGCTYNDIIDNINNDKKLLTNLNKVIEINGVIPQSEIQYEYMKADFSVFIRPYRGSSNAGFPTKLAESMQSGIPVISNDTGDIGLYLKNNYNGYLLKDDKVSTIEETLRKIVILSKSEKDVLKRNARITAESNFDYRNYSEELNQFINEINESEI